MFFAERMVLEIKVLFYKLALSGMNVDTLFHTHHHFINVKLPRINLTQTTIRLHGETGGKGGKEDKLVIMIKQMANSDI